MRRGQLATFEMGGGFVRRPAPSDSLLLDLRSETILLCATVVRSALRGAPTRSGNAEIRRGRRGESVVLEVNGGFCRRTLDTAGLLISTRLTTVFLPIPLTRTLLAELRSRTAERP